MHKSAMKCNKILGKWCKNKHGASKIMDMFETYQTTPYELWRGKKPKLSFLRVWGCEAYVKKLQPDKLEIKAKNASL
jgi:hypothetical protein